MKAKTKPLLLRSITNVLEFGKHKGKTVQEVFKCDPNWIHWALQNIPEFKLNKNALLLLPPYKEEFTHGRDFPYASYDEFKND